ncbi:MAG: DUF4350 domain-containing protein [Mesorhizobium sp.]|uniref:DUF4350 domain-containing protein n=1 Tax=Mesorhizobium sp. TaxID=1871066 RepID=UPI000FE6B7D5|nr:DUF4350 domain-containing protein [Mesorhizobium sp.]RWH79238.1 MAG: DUF4350 domain-containing protein [Mesorhizobium sp.]RWH81766.1 MAG: DUF4350 domain-containing protein [Mesorhizobium sp.]RWH88032.1 MAG: DUF4350 domain-containing protein [Mesorhizobium sp.]RWI01644.1 MAG: DUF4350 domain-containing protein [Mesorhizobium sp.]RWI02091.1 MAG: DUF4350 domain-containing protein [Mesorhizobium sp.]
MSAATVEPAAQEPFNRRTLFWGIFASLLAAAGFFLLSTYAPDFRQPGNGGATPLSKSGVGYAGLAEWLRLTGETPAMARTEDDLGTDMLLIVTISPESDPAALDHILELRQDQDTLFVLPKWQTLPLEEHEGWNMKFGRLPDPVVNQWLGRIANAKIGIGQSTVQQLDIEGRLVAAPDELQWVADEHPIIAAGNDKAVLTEVDGKPFYVLTDPDLINNAALGNPDKAAAALDLIALLQPEKGPVMFDLTLHGAGRKYDLAKLLVEPPFLALTLTILAAAALAFLHGLGRFGPPRAELRAIAFGKRALVDTTAMLLRRAGRLEELEGRYAALMRVRAGALLGAPQGLQGEALDRWLDSRDKDEVDGFTARAQAAGEAKNLTQMHEAAERLHDWTARRLGERR